MLGGRNAAANGEALAGEEAIEYNSEVEDEELERGEVKKKKAS